MKKGQDTRGYERYLALDIHREYILVGAWNEKKDWVLTPRRVSIEKFPEWAKKNIRPGDIVVLETTTNVWTIYDIVAPLAGRGEAVLGTMGAACRPDARSRRLVRRRETRPGCRHPRQRRAARE